MAQTRHVSLLLIVAWLVFAASAIASIGLWPAIHVILGLGANTLILISGSIIVWKTAQQTIGWILVSLGLIFTVTGGVLLGIQNAYETDWARVVTEGGIGGIWLFIYLILIFAVAGSTLAVAALFNPVRLRVQQRVDRRFNRSHYEAQSVIDSFASTLQDEPDLENLVERLQAVVIETMGPSLVGT
jgi:hypothetical protein